MRIKYRAGVGVAVVVVLMLMTVVCNALSISKNNISKKTGARQFVGGGFYGHVYDKSNSHPIAGAVVVAISLLTRSKYFATTDSTGYYQIDVPIGGPYRLKARAEGYRTKVTTSYVLDSFYQEVNFYLTKTKDSQQNIPSGDVKKVSWHMNLVRTTKLLRFFLS